MTPAIVQMLDTLAVVQKKYVATLSPNKLDAELAATLGALRAAVEAEQARGHVVVTWCGNRSRIVAVTRQDEEGRILSIIAQEPAQAKGVGTSEPFAYYDGTTKVIVTERSIAMHEDEDPRYAEYRNQTPLYTLPQDVTPFAYFDVRTGAAVTEQEIAANEAGDPRYAELRRQVPLFIAQPGMAGG